MSLNAANPFQSLPVQVPKKYLEDVRAYSQTQAEGGPRPDSDYSPFQRYIDFWFLAFSLGARIAVEQGMTEATLPDFGEEHTFNQGSILASDPFRIELIELTCIALTDDPFIIGEQAREMRMANRLAAIGISPLLEILRSEGDLPIWALSDAMEKLLKEATS